MFDHFQKYFGQKEENVLRETLNGRGGVAMEL